MEMNRMIMDIKDATRVSMSYLVRVWEESTVDPWQFWIKTLTNNKEHTFSSPEAIVYFIPHQPQAPFPPLPQSSFPYRF